MGSSEGPPYAEIVTQQKHSIGTAAIDTAASYEVVVASLRVFQ